MQQQGEAKRTSVVCATRLAWRSVVLERIPIHMLGPAPSVGTMTATVSAITSKVNQCLWLPYFSLMDCQPKTEHNKC